jgi:hypothetical protein
MPMGKRSNTSKEKETTEVILTVSYPYLCAAIILNQLCRVISLETAVQEVSRSVNQSGQAMH